MTWKSAAVKVIIAVVAVSALLFFSSDYLLGLLTARPDFQLSVSPTSIRLGYVGSSNTTVITVKSVNGFDSVVKFDVKPFLGLLGVRFILNSSEVHLPANGEVSCTLKVEATFTIAQGQYYIDVSGVAGNLTRTVRVTVEVSY